MKKSLLAMGFALTAVSAAQASSAYNGYYLGVSSGWDSRSTKGEISALNYSKNKRHSGFAYGLYTGFGRVVNCFYMGSELTLGASSANRRISHDVNGQNVRMKYDRGAVLGLAPRFGASVMNGLLAYVKLGMEYSRDKVEAKVGEASDETRSKNMFTFVPGLGLEKAFGRVVARLEYTHNLGSRKSLNNNVRLKYSGDRVTVGVAYKF